THEIGRAHRLDLAAQPVEGAAVDAGEESSITPLGHLGGHAGREATAQDIALALDAGQRGVNLERGDAERGGEGWCGDVADRAEPRANGVDVGPGARGPRVRAPWVARVGGWRRVGVEGKEGKRIGCGGGGPAGTQST